MHASSVDTGKMKAANSTLQCQDTTRSVCYFFWHHYLSSSSECSFM